MKKTKGERGEGSSGLAVRSLESPRMYSHKLSNDTRNSATISRVSSVLITTMPTEVSSLVLFRHAEAKCTDFSPSTLGTINPQNIECEDDCIES
ncbi:hypothetical protein V1478_018806 [Vespula squamosa]|uniref:Uncharacterized protein n=1 Tax=Vespula squamosa TaxID=30214 RepID=A0ABD1ZWB1_VESSQ